MGVNVYVCALPPPCTAFALCREFQASVYAPCAFARKSCAVYAGDASFVRWILRSWSSIARDLGTLRSVISVVPFEAPERR
jgi:hypothetical protein